MGSAFASGGAISTGTGSATGYTLHTFTTTGNSSFVVPDLGTRLRASVGGDLSGSGALVFSGPGTLTLTGSNTFTGLTTVSAGTLSIGNGGTAGSMTGNIANNSALVFNRSNASTYAGAISGSGSVTKLGAGTLTLSGSSSYTGGTVVSAGTLSITNSNALGQSGTVVLGNAATGSSAVTLRSTVDLARDITVSTSGSGVARIEGDTNFITYSGGLLLNRPTTLGGAATDRYGVSGRISGPVGTLTIDAPRVTFDQTAANANTFTGSVAINPGRILQLNTVNALSGSHAVAANGTLYLVVGTGSTATIGTLSGTGLVSPNPSVAGLQTLSVGSDNGSGTFGGSLANGGGTLAWSRPAPAPRRSPGATRTPAAPWCRPARCRCRDRAWPAAARGPWARARCRSPRGPR